MAMPSSMLVTDAPQAIPDFVTGPLTHPHPSEQSPGDCISTHTHKMVTEEFNLQQTSACLVAVVWTEPSTEQPDETCTMPVVRLRRLSPACDVPPARLESRRAPCLMLR